MPQASNKQSIDWFKTMIHGLRGSAGARKRANIENFSPAQHAFIGGLFFFKYDAKYKDQLPYWDKFPMVIPFEITPDGFIGLNLHYMPPQMRLAVFKKLQSKTVRAGTPRARMQINYQMLQGMIKSKAFDQVIHRYLASHIRSNIVRVKDEAWENAITLPVQKFQGASARQVWRAVQ